MASGSLPPSEHVRDLVRLGRRAGVDGAEGAGRARLGGGAELEAALGALLNAITSGVDGGCADPAAARRKRRIDDGRKRDVGHKHEGDGLDYGVDGCPPRHAVQAVLEELLEDGLLARQRVGEHIC